MNTKILSLFPKIEKLFAPKRSVFQHGGPEDRSEQIKEQTDLDKTTLKILEMMEKSRGPFSVENKDPNWSPETFDKVAKEMAEKFFKPGSREARLTQNVIVVQLDQMLKNSPQDFENIRKGGFKFFVFKDGEFLYSKDKEGKELYNGPNVKVVANADKLPPKEKSVEKAFKPFYLKEGSTFGRISQEEAKKSIEAALGHELKNEDHIIIERKDPKQEKTERYELAYRGGKLVTRNNTNIMLFEKDRVIRYIPNKSEHKKTESVQVSVDNKPVSIVGYIDKPQDTQFEKNKDGYYTDLVQSIIEGDPQTVGEKLKVDPRVITDQIRASYNGMHPEEAVKEYKAVLMQANEAYEKSGSDPGKLILVAPAGLSSIARRPTLTGSSDGKAIESGKFVTIPKEKVSADEGFAIETGGKKPVYMSREKLAELYSGPPGVPLSESWKIQADLGNTDVIKDARKLFTSLGLHTESEKGVAVSRSATIVDDQENRKDIIGQSAGRFNVDYKGRRLTVKIEKGVFGRTISIAPGYNQTAFSDSFSDSFGFDADDNKKEFDKILRGDAYAASAKLEAKESEEGVILNSLLLKELNDKLTFVGPNGQVERIDLDGRQMLELIFRLNSFEELVKEGAVQKIKGQEKNYIVAKLPAKLSGPSVDTSVKQLAFALKWGGRMNENLTRQVSGSQETAQEKVSSKQDLYRRNLKRIFLPAAAAYKKSGETVSMNNLGSEDTYTRDLFYEKFAGGSALQIIEDQVSTVNAKGEAEIDEAKATAKLQDLFRRGINKLDAMPKEMKKYGDLKKDLASNPSLRNEKRVSISNIQDWDMDIIRLGLISQQREAELKQREPLVAQIQEQLEKSAVDLTKLYNEQFPDLKITEPQMEAALKKIPVSALFSANTSIDSKGLSNTGFGLHSPIVAPLLETKKGSVNLVLVPGVGIQEKNASWHQRLNFQAGISADWLPHERVRVFGGVSIGAGMTTEVDKIFTAGVSGGIDFKVYKADVIHNWDHFIGIQGGAGFDLLKEGAGLNVGLTTKFKLDIEQRYKRMFAEKLATERLTEAIKKLGEAKNHPLDPKALNELATYLLGNADLLKKLGLTAQSKPQEMMVALEGYVHAVRKDFDENFDLPAVTGGEVQVNAVHGVLLATGLVSGNLPVVLGTTVAWGVQVLASLDFNVGSELAMKRTRTTSEAGLNSAEAADRAAQLKALEYDKAFDTMPMAAQLSGFNRLGRAGEIRTEQDPTTKIEDIQLDNLLSYNEILRPRGIALEQEKGTGKIKINFLPFLSQGQTNVKVLVSPGLAVVGDNGNVYLRNPNALRKLFVDSNSRYYPFFQESQKKVGNATKETVVMITDDPKNFENMKPEMKIAKYNGESAWKVESGIQANPETYRGAMDKETMKKNYDEIMASLGGPSEPEPVRPDIRQLAAKVYEFKNSKNQIFLDITNRGSIKAVKKNGDNYSKEELFQHFDEYAAKKGLPPFNAKEKTILMLECSTLRYIKLDKANLKGELEWCKTNVLIPTFRERIQNIKAKYPEYPITKTAEVLANEAIQDLGKIKLDDPIDQTVDEKTAVAIAVGNKGNGFHHMLNGKMDGYPGDYGYILGEDYTKALQDKNHPRHELALVLKEQMAPLPDVDEALSNPKEVQEFMNTPLSRAILSIPALALVLGPKQYAEVNAYLKSQKTPPDIIANQDGLKSFIDIVKTVRSKQDQNLQAASITGYDGQKHLFLLRLGMDSGVFNKCGNYSILFREQVAIVPKKEAMKIFSTGRDQVVNVDARTVKNFYGLGVGFNNTLDISPEGDVTLPPGVEPEAGPGSKSEVNPTTTDSYNKGPSKTGSTA